MTRRRGGRPTTRELPLPEAIALGTLQGPAELLPVSSSGHLVLVPELLGWRYARLDPELRKAFEVAVHAATAGALTWARREEVLEAIAGLDARRVTRMALTFLPPALAGLIGEKAIAQRAGTVRTVAGAQALAGLALAAADRRPDDRPYERAGAVDHLLLGLAQAAALVPGVSRNGATLTVARARRLDRAAASRLSRQAALPVVLGATALEAVRLAERGAPPEVARALACAALAAVLSTLAGRGLLERVERARTLAPIAAYRVALGAVALRLAAPPRV